MRSVRTKLLGSFAIVLVFVFAFGWTGLSQIKQVSNYTDEVTDQWLFGTEAILQTNLKIERFLSNYYQIQAVKDDAEQSKQLADARALLVTAIDEDIQKYESTLSGEQDQVHYQALVQAWNQFQSDLARTADPSATQEEAAAAMDTVSKSFDLLKTQIQNLVEFNHEGAVNSKNESESVYEATSSVLFFLGIGILIVVGVLAWLLIVNLTRPLKATTAVMNRIAAGDLRDRREKGARVGVTRIAEKLRRRAVLDHSAAIDDINAVGEFAHDAEIVRDEQDRGAAPLGQFVHQAERLGLHRDVERGAGLVGH